MEGKSMASAQSAESAGRIVSAGQDRLVRLMRMRMDYVLILVVAALLILGLMMVYSSTYDMAYVSYGDSNHFFSRQLIWMVLGLTILIILARIDYHLWERWAVLLMAGTLLLLGVVLIAGSRKFGAQRWITNGSIQPSELAKVSVVIYIAAWVTSKGSKIRQVSYGLLPFAILIGLVTGLILLQRDLSTALLIAVTAWMMFFFAGADLIQLVATVVFGLATFVFFIAREPYRMERITTFLNPEIDPSGSSFQVKQALAALASGGILGKGLGASSQKFGFVPAVHTDTILAVLGEELGLIGCLVLIGLFILLAYRGFKVALEAQDSFGTVLAAGLTCALAFQALTNMAVVTATVPYAGVPLPFISYGGSSMVTSMACIGLLLSISRGHHVPARRTGTTRRRPGAGRGDTRNPGRSVSGGRKTSAARKAPAGRGGTSARGDLRRGNRRSRVPPTGRR
jgi:cell division protein FtsW